MSSTTRGGVTDSPAARRPGQGRFTGLGPYLDCLVDFATQAQPQAQYDRERSDPHDLDRDNDGIAWEELLEAPTGTTGPVVTTLPNIGYGTDANAAGALLPLLGGLSLVIGAVGVAWWQRRTK